MNTVSRLIWGLVNAVLVIIIVVGIAVLYNQTEEIEALKAEIKASDARVIKKIDELSKSVANVTRPSRSLDVPAESPSSTPPKLSPADTTTPSGSSAGSPNN